MAARGARARKVVEKQLEKEDCKATGRISRDSNYPKRHDMRYGANSPPPATLASPPISQVLWSRRPTYSSGAESVISGHSGHSGSKQVTAMDKLSARLSTSSGGSKEAKTFVARGKKATMAPRGRFGGVPVKMSELSTTRAGKSSRPSHMFDTTPNSVAGSSNQSFRSAALQEMSWESTKVWAGNGAWPRPYCGFEHDDELWMSDGDCLIFFSGETSVKAPRPLLRLHTKVLQEAGSTFLANLLMYGEIMPPLNVSTEQDATNLTSAATKEQQSLPPIRFPDINLQQDVIPEFPAPPATTSSPTYTTNRRYSWATSNSDSHTIIEKPPRPQPSMHIPTSVVEESRGPSCHSGSNDGADIEITHEIWFRAPSHIKRPDVQRRHHIATRNFLALLYNAPIIGNDFHEMLSDLHHVMESFYDLNEQTDRRDIAQAIIRYLESRQLDDVQNNINAALGLLAWSEHPDVAWEAGYLEAFVHSVGMMSEATTETREYRALSQATQKRLYAAFKALQSKLIEAEGRLERFSFEELWFVDGIIPDHPAQLSFEALRTSLCDFYSAEYGEWPPKVNRHGRWLNSEIVMRLQADFGGAYEYLVNRDIVWESNEERHTRKWEMISTSAEPAGFSADSPGFPLTDMLIGFDSSQRYDHLPHPYPLLPTATKPAVNAPDNRSKHLLSRLKRSKSIAVANAKTQFQMGLAFTSATNINQLGARFKGNRLVDALAVFEKTTQIAGVSPQDARLGRWILIYGILELLSTLSVDTAGLKYSEGSRYFLAPSLDGCPPWKDPEAPRAMVEASQQSSYCWLVAEEWAAAKRSANSTKSTKPQQKPIEDRKRQKRLNTAPQPKSLPADTADEKPDMNVVRTELKEYGPPFPEPAATAVGQQYHLYPNSPNRHKLHHHPHHQDVLFPDQIPPSLAPNRKLPPIPKTAPYVTDIALGEMKYLDVPIMG